MKHDRRRVPQRQDRLSPSKPPRAALAIRSGAPAGTFLVTILFNVPRNDALAAVDPASAEGARLWAGYVTSWTARNHVRAVAALAAMAALTLALCLARDR